VRCLVCQNENIDESNADLARDLRLLVRERLVAGDTDEEVFAFLVARYGDWVLFSPPWKPSTYALWLAPFVLLLVGSGIVYVVVTGSRRRKQAVALSDDEEKAVAELLAQNGGGQ
jgi:cytochrome c-type biogenesis protein CcmH